MKKCTKCGTEKESSEFHSDRTTRDGKKFICKTCLRTPIELKKYKRPTNDDDHRIGITHSWCNRCKEIKTFDQFGKNKINSLGINYICKSCIKVPASKRKRYIYKTNIEDSRIGVTHRQCIKCKEIKSYDGFYVLDSGRKHSNICKNCIMIPVEKRKIKLIKYETDIRIGKTHLRCSKCNEIKLFEDFGKSTRGKTRFGFTYECKRCVYMHIPKNKRKKNKITHFDDSRIGTTHKICSKCKKIKAFSEFNKNRSKYQGLHDSCKICSSKDRKKRKKKYPERSREWHRNYMSTRRHNDINFKILGTLRKRIISLLSYKKQYRTIDLVGCTVEFFLNHLESLFVGKMSFKNHGKYWAIDHIIPCASFDLDDEIQQFQCFHWSNQQPLTVKDNSSKGDKFDPLDKIAYLAKWNELYLPTALVSIALSKKSKEDKALIGQEIDKILANV